MIYPNQEGRQMKEFHFYILITMLFHAAYLFYCLEFYHGTSILMGSNQIVIRQMIS